MASTLPPRPPALRATLAVLLLGVLAAAAPAGDARVRPGEWNPGKVPEGWVAIETEHYQVQSQCGEAKGRRLGDHVEACLEMYAEMLPFRKRMPRFVVKLFADRAEYLDYGAPRGSVAYYSKGRKEIVGYDTGVVAGVRDIPDVSTTALDVVLDDEERARLEELLAEVTDAYTMDAAGVLAHEGWHQYFHYYTVSWVQMPSWIDEGVGDYFYTARYDEQQGGFVLGDLNEGRLRSIRYAFDDGTSVPFGELLGFAQRDYYENPGVFYAQGWSMVHFLMHHEDPELAGLIPEYVEYFKDKKSIEKTNRRIFRDLDLEQLDREWIGWVLRRPFRDPMATLAREFGTRLRPEQLVAHDALATSRIRSAYAERLGRLGIEGADGD